MLIASVLSRHLNKRAPYALQYQYPKLLYEFTLSRMLLICAPLAQLIALEVRNAEAGYSILLKQGYLRRSLLR